MSKHKYHEVIKAWANGEIILGKHRLSTVWNEFNNSQVVNFNCSDWEWKLKPKLIVGYMNIYHCKLNEIDYGSSVFNSYEEAFNIGKKRESYITTIKIEYENKSSRKETSQSSCCSCC